MSLKKLDQLGFKQLNLSLIMKMKNLGGQFLYLKIELLLVLLELVLMGKFTIIKKKFISSKKNRIITGGVYIFEKIGSTWTKQAKIFPNDPQALKFFGWSVSLFHNLIAIGAPYEDRENL